MTFLLDDQVSYFISKAPGFPIAQTVFSATGLVDGYHNLTIVNGHPNSSFAQVMMFLDSIIYTCCCPRSSFLSWILMITP